MHVGFQRMETNKMVLRRDKGGRLHTAVESSLPLACEWRGTELHKPHLGVLVHSSHSSAQEAVAGRLDLRTSWVT